MGATGSKGEDHAFDRGSTLSLSSKRRSSKVDELQSVTDTITRIKDEIEYYNGTRADPRYEECQKILADLSSRLQDLKKSGKRKSTARIDDILDDIKVCFRLLEEKVASNDAKEQNLDMASIESHSFINQNVNKFEQAKKPEFHGSMDSMISASGYHPKKEKPKYRPISTIDLLEQQVENIEKEVKSAVELEDTKQFLILEKKIQILYTDLEMIPSDAHTPMSERKEGLEKRLIKCNNQLKKTKRSMDRRSRTSSQIDSKASTSSVVDRREVKSVADPVSTEQMDEIGKILSELEEYLLKVQVFDGTKKDDDYKRLVGKLEEYWSKVYNIEEFSNIDRTRKIDTIEKIKFLIKKLETKAEQNAKILLAKADINRIEDDLQICNRSINSFRGKKGDDAYTNIDQKLRLLWDNLGRIDAGDAIITKKKNEIIDKVQDALKNLEEKATVENVIEPVQVLAHQNVLDEDYIPQQLLKQAEEFQNHWSQLEYNLNKQKLKNKEHYQNIVAVLDNVSESLTFFINEHRTSIDSPQSAPNKIQSTSQSAKSSRDEQRAQFFNSIRNEPEHLEQKSLASSIVSEIVRNNFILDTRNYKKPDLISSEKDLRVAVDNEESKSKIQTLSATNVLAEVQRMRVEAKDLVKQINHSDVGDEKIYLRIKNELRQLQDSIKAIDSDGTQTLSLHKTKTEKYINDGLQKLEEKRTELKRKEDEEKSKSAASKSESSPGRISVSRTLQDIMNIDANVQYLQKQIQKFEGITKDPAYTKIESGLAESQSKLGSIDINGYDNLRISKNEIIQQIGKYKKELEDKLVDNQKNYKNSNPNLISIGSEEPKRQVSQELKSVIEEVQKLKSQVERFSGIYKGIQYKQIEDSFNLTSAKLEALDSKGNDKIENAKAQTSQKIEQYLKILEDKSMKVAKVSPEASTEGKEEDVNKNEIVVTTTKPVTTISATTSPSASTDKNINPLIISFQQIEALRNKLVTIKESVESFQGTYKDSNYIKLENDLLACKQDINKIEDHSNASINTSKNQYIEYIDKLLKYFEDKMNIDRANSDWDRNPLEEMKETEKELSQLKKDIDKFEMSQGEEVLKDLDERLTKLIEKIESIDIGNLTNLRDHKNKILFEIQQTVNLLNDKAVSPFPEELQQILREIAYVNHGVNEFKGTRYDKKYAELDEALIHLMMRIRGVDTRTSTAVADECVKAIQRIQELMKVLQEKVRIPGLDDKAPLVHNLGTFV
ncbi:spindle pole body component 110-like [Agrilus planipennis]|uniref:Spindle pole body component 110-like n=1 Tax=Agrilus planipennis TaxID=224129 RepID=A0A1W4WNV2_AGRPL|nr:spindle pole body component 110-like [Agrilus planipennis]